MSTTPNPPQKDWLIWYVVVGAFTLVFGILAWMFFKANIQIVIRGEIDPTIFISFLVGSLLTAAMSWLFGKKGT